MTPAGRLGQLRTLVALRRVLAERRRLDIADEATRDAWRAARVRALRRHAVRSSPYYREAHRGLEEAPLEALPPVTKDDLVERFDELVTDRRLRLDVARGVVEEGDPARRALGRYRVAMSSGSSGRPGLLAFDRREWVELLAAAARARGIAGPSGRAGRVRSARIGSPAPWHLSRQLAGTLQDPRKPSLDLSAAADRSDLVDALQRWQPDVLAGYASVLAALAADQQAGRLAIQPAQVLSGGEVLTAGARRLISEAWGVEPFDQYVTTEAGFVAIECRAHDGMHVLDDHVVVEVVDDEGRPVAPGAAGSRVLLTVLGSRTLPLIRYQLDDAVTWDDGPCRCGRRSPRVTSVVATPRALLRLPAADGTDASVHPVAFTAVLDGQPVRAWQVVHGPDGLRVRVVEPGPGFAADRLGDQLRRVLAAAGAAPPSVTVEVVDEIARAASGKAALVVEEQAG